MSSEPKVRIYISGKITGIESEAVELFARAERELQDRGYEVVNPMTLNHDHDKSWEAYMKADIKALCDCQEIYMLSNWQDSKGAKIEHDIANLLFIKVQYEENIIDIGKLTEELFKIAVHRDVVKDVDDVSLISMKCLLEKGIKPLLQENVMSLLPPDEEIKKHAEYRTDFWHRNGRDMSVQREYFCDGADWARSYLRAKLGAIGFDQILK